VTPTRAIPERIEVVYDTALYKSTFTLLHFTTDHQYKAGTIRYRAKI